MEEKSVKTIAVVVVVGIALYAIYELFSGSQVFSGLGAPGQITANLSSIPGVPGFRITAPTSATPQALASTATGVLAEYAPAFGPGENTTSSSETDYTDLDYSDIAGD